MFSLPTFFNISTIRIQFLDFTGGEGKRKWEIRFLTIQLYGDIFPFESVAPSDPSLSVCSFISIIKTKFRSRIQI